MHNNNNNNNNNSNTKYNIKIYLDDYPPQNILSKLDLLDKLYKQTKNHIEIISTDGIFHIENNKLYKLINHDKQIIQKNNLILDKSICIKNIHYSQIPFEHISTNITSIYYGHHKNIQFVIEGIYETNIQLKKEKYNINDKYYHFIPTNFYFLANEDFDFDNILLMEEINVFLSMLN